MKIERIIVAILILLSMAWYYKPQLSVNGDSSCYILLGKGLGDGKGYTNWWRPIPEPHKNHPILLPLFIAAINTAHNHNASITTFKLYINIISFIALFLIYLFFRQYMSRIAMALFLIIVLLNFEFMSFTHIVMAEFPFILITYMTLHVLAKYNNKRSLVACLILSLIAINLRRIGIAIFCTVCIVELKRQWKYMRFAVKAILIILFLITCTLLYNNYQYSYSFSLEKFLGVLINYESSILINFREAMLPLVHYVLYFRNNHFIMKFLSCILLSLMAVGAFKSKNRIIVLYFAIYIVPTMILSHPGHIVRYLYPVAPVMIYFLINGLLVTCRYKAKTSMPIVPKIGFAILLFIFLAIAQRPYEKELRYYSPDWWAYIDCLEWVSNNTSDSAVICSRKDDMSALLCDRTSITFPRLKGNKRMSADKVLQYLIDNNVNYIISDSFKWSRSAIKYINPVIMTYKDRFKLVFAIEESKFYVFKFDRKRL